MRTYGRIMVTGWTADSLTVTADSGNTADGGVPGTLAWVEVDTAADGSNDLVWLTTLCQCLRLNLGESPFYSRNGIPAAQAVAQQVPPDYYVALTQQAFSPYFASLQISKQSGRTPTYDVRVITHQGVVLNASVPIPI